ncbi:MAG: 1-acyl-sn-glycerol-3-phosphate acyltransferase [Polaribacter sp.]
MKNSQLWFRSVRFYIKIGMYFYIKKIRVVGKENIPKKGAVLFAVNHPNGLVDPLLVTTNNVRTSYFLVKAGAFKNPIYKKILNSLNLIAIYRMRDGIDQLAKNEEVFNKCFNILHRKESLMIFPEGSDNRNRTVRTLSKGFTRIVFGAIEKYPDVKIKVVPVGVTYQNSTQYPCKAAVHYGIPIDANEIYNDNTLATSINILKQRVTEQLKTLSVHLENDENYQSTVSKLNKAQVDFTEVNAVNSIIKSGVSLSEKKASVNYIKPLFYIIILNSIIPYLIWKKISNNNTDKDFTDTLRLGSNIFLFPFFYVLQAIIISQFYNWKIGVAYFFASLLLVFLYTKLSPTPTESHLE